MDEQNEKQTEETTQDKQEAGGQKQLDMRERATRGTLTLVRPIRAGGKDVTELHYDFSRLTGWEFADAMDMDTRGTHFFRLTRKQAVSMFAATAAKETPGVDAIDIRERMGVEDAIAAMDIAIVFLNTSTRAARKDT